MQIQERFGFYLSLDNANHGVVVGNVIHLHAVSPHITSFAEMHCALQIDSTSTHYES